ncbi:MAG: LTA synthase family protein [Rhodanobacter sp.]
MKSIRHIAAPASSRGDSRPVWIYAVGLSLIYLAALAVYFYRLQASPGVGMAASTLLAGLLELVVFANACAWLLKAGPLRQGRFRAFVFSLAVLVFTFAWLAQIYALLISNSFISVLAMENASEAFLTSSPWRNLMLVAGAAACVVLIARSWRREGHAPARNSGRGGAILLLGCLGGIVAFNAGSSIAGGQGRLVAGQSPLASLLRVAASLAQVGHASAQTLPLAVAGAGRQLCGVTLAPGRFPFLKTGTSLPPLPFTATRTVKKPNVIVVFVEGESARLLESYGGHYPGLTPNMSRMARQAMAIDDYFNHTAATFRGLQGQLTSGYPVHGGVSQGSGWVEGNAAAYEKRSYSSLPKILGRDGYESVFFSPHSPSDAMTALVRMLGFEQIYTAKRSRAELLDRPEPMFGGGLSDEDQYGALIQYLRKRQSSSPFFISLYSLGTHAFLDIPSSAKGYGEGRNASLNTLHAADAAFGKFYDYFMSSKYADDTLLILTVDHAHYPEPPFVAVAGSDLKPYFVDRIPMFIHAPWLQLPARYDVHGRTSLDLAPTILQLIGVNPGRDSFLGHTLFDRAYDRDFSIAAIGQAVYAIYRGQVYGPSEIPSAIDGEYNRCKAVVQTYYANELSQTIFPPAGTAAEAKVENDALADDQLRLLPAGALAVAAQGGCAFDSVDGSNLKPGVPWPLKSTQPFIASGWVVDHKLHSAGRFTLLLKSTQDGNAKAYGVEGQAGVPRPDVAAALQAPQADKAGFRMIVDPAGVPAGTYKVMTLLDTPHEKWICDTKMRLAVAP